MTVNLNSAENKIESITLNMSAIEFMIFHEAISKYAEERENEIDREVTKRMLNVISELKGENNDNWFAEMEEAENRYEYEKWVESLEKGEQE